MSRACDYFFAALDVHLADGYSSLDSLRRATEDYRAVYVDTDNRSELARAARVALDRIAEEAVMSESLKGGIDVYNMLAREDAVAKAMADGASKVKPEAVDDPLDYAFLKLAASQYYLDRAVECLRNAEQCLTQLAHAMKEDSDENQSSE